MSQIYISTSSLRNSERLLIALSVTIRMQLFRIKSFEHLASETKPLTSYRRTRSLASTEKFVFSNECILQESFNRFTNDLIIFHKKGYSWASKLLWICKMYFIRSRFNSTIHQTPLELSSTNEYFFQMEMTFKKNPVNCRLEFLMKASP
jgi:hypothetical protein